MISVKIVDVNGNARTINLGQELASGGAGTVHVVIGDPSIVVKLYNTETLKSDGQIYAEKIKCMLKSVPSIAGTKAGVVELAWPNALAQDLSGHFVGFAMPALDFQNTEGLQSLLIPKLARLKFKNSNLGIRITVAANLSTVVSSIHAKGHQIVDLKPPNLRLYRNGLQVAVLDCDGFQIQLPGRKLPAPQVTPEYLAPEFQTKDVSNPEHQDRFALAVIIFKLLNFGIHPYAGKAKISNAPNDIEVKIAQGMYSYGITPHQMFEAVQQSSHHCFPDELRRLFDRAFGTFVDKRPTAREWADVLINYAKIQNPLLKECSHGHLWFIGQPCGECHRNLIITGGQTTSTKASYGGINAIGKKTTAATKVQKAKQVAATANNIGLQTYENIGYTNGDTYEGYISNNNRNGRGIYIWINGDKYEGDWVDGDRNGYGTFTYSNGTRQEGFWTYNQLVRSCAVPQPQIAAQAVIQPKPVPVSPYSSQPQITSSKSGNLFLGIIVVCLLFSGIAYISHFLNYNTWSWIAVVVGLLVANMSGQTKKDGFAAAIIFILLFSSGKYSWDWVFSDVNKQATDQVINNKNKATKVKKQGSENVIQKNASHTPRVKDSDSFAPSFDCVKAVNRTERLICSDRELAGLDVKLNDIYKKARDVEKDKERFKLIQLNWLDNVRNNYSDKKYLTFALQNRISQLNKSLINNVNVHSKQKYDDIGQWSKDDSKRVAEGIIKDSLVALSNDWINHQSNKANSKSWLVITKIRFLPDESARSDEFINTDALAMDMAQVLVKTSNVGLITQKNQMDVQANYLLSGTINTIIDESVDIQIRYYQVDFTLIELVNNQKIWTGQVKLNKTLNKKLHSDQ